MAAPETIQGDRGYGKRQSFEILRAQLELERSSFMSHWRDLADFIRPRRARFYTNDVNRGERRNQKIIDATATLASRTLRSGMMAGVTSPARPWFRLTVADADMEENQAVQEWLHITSERMRTMFLKSNLYNMLPVVYGDLGDFGTAAMMIEEDAENGVLFHSFPVGSYMIATNDKGRVDVFFREFQMTVRQIVNRFGRDPNDPTTINWDNISSKVKSLWETKNTEAWVQVAHCIKPNENYDPKKLESKFKRYISVYYEQGVAGQKVVQGYFNAMGPGWDTFLSEKGYDFFPVMCPRWEVTGEDSYGTDCPGMTTLGDIKQLQKGEQRSLEAVDKMIRPPLVGPSSLKTQNVSLLPGDITYVDQREGMQGLKALHDVRFDLNAMEAKQDQVRQRIRRGYFEDLFLMLASTDRRQITAREIEERHEEKLLALGPVLEQLNQDLLDPLIDNTFAIMLEQEAVPPAPEELRGRDLKVEYISIMAQAQKLVGLGGIERFTNYVGGIAGIAPDILMKVNGDQLVDVYAELTSIPPGIVRSDEDVAAIRQQQAQAQAEQQRLANAQAAASTAKQLAEVPMGGEDNMLMRMADTGALA